MLSYIQSFFHSEPESHAYVSELYIHPVKSLGAIKLDECEIDEYGFKYDRIFMVCEPDRKNRKDPRAYRFVTQREAPRFTLIEPELDLENDQLILRYPPKDISLTLPLTVPLEVCSEAPRVNAWIWQQTPQSIDLSEHYPEIPAFFDEIRGTDTGQTTIVAPDIRRFAGKGIPDKELVRKTAVSSFQEYFPGNLICQESLDVLDAMVRENTDDQVQLSPINFRPNMVITGTLTAWDEDDWRRIKVGGHYWYVSCRNARCKITTVNLRTGLFEASDEPYRTMCSFRKIDAGAKGCPCFGMQLCHEEYGYTMKVGDHVQVLKRGEHHYPAPPW